MFVLGQPTAPMSSTNVEGCGCMFGPFTDMSVIHGMCLLLTAVCLDAYMADTWRAINH